MNIRMYDCGFGDSFLLSDYWDQRNLLVDFGIHSGSSAVNRTAQYDTICTEIMAHENVDYLLTHYHEDHYEGAIVASAKGIRFENVYIPDIWNIDGSVDIVSLILFRGLLTKTVISQNLTLFDFLKAICTCSGEIHFIQRGSNVGRECTALWPSIEYLESRGQKVFDELDPEDSNIIARLREISSRLVEIVQSLSREEYVLERSYDYIQQLEEIKSLIQKGAVDPESVKIHVKVDSGMHRLGFQTGEISDICRILKENGIDVRGIYSHFGDMPHLQQKAFEGAAHATREYFPNAVRHIASSHTLNQKECLFDGVRVGLAAYLGAMRVESEVIASRRVSAGEYVGYGDYSLPNDANIATVFGGYADGIDRERFPCVIADGREYKVIGVCMDTFIIDTADKKFEIGKKVTLVDENEMCNLAEKMQTIPYTLMTAWRGRIDKIYC